MPPLPCDACNYGTCTPFSQQRGHLFALAGYLNLSVSDLMTALASSHCSRPTPTALSRANRNAADRLLRISRVGGAI